jgi:hypothetical protein
VAQLFSMDKLIRLILLKQKRRSTRKNAWVSQPAQTGCKTAHRRLNNTGHWAG